MQSVPCGLPSSGTEELDLELENSQQHTELCFLADMGETQQAKGVYENLY